MSNNVTFQDFPDRESWLKGRMNGIGASEVACAIGLSHFKTTTELWEEKVGLAKPPDLSDNESVEYGNEAEEHIRALFALKNKNVYDMEYHKFRVYRNNKHPWLTATLDGELIRKSDGKRGIWECKTHKITSKIDLDNWRDKIPQHYYVQVCSQMATLDYDFAILTAELIFQGGNSEIRNYPVDRENREDDIRYIITESGRFWESVQKKTRPKLRFML